MATRAAASGVCGAVVLTHTTAPLGPRAAVGLPPAAARWGRWSPKVRAGARSLTVRCKSIDTAASAFGINDDAGMERDMSGNRWERVMLKVSGEALAGPNGFGIDNEVVQAVAREVAIAVLSGVQVAIVVGGGNFFRGAKHEGAGLDRASADYMGMLATVMNCLSMQAALEAVGIPNRVQSAISIKEVAEPYIRRRAIRHLEKGRVVIFAAGTGNPFFTTDTAAALRAAEINAQAVLKATKVDGVYDKDPNVHADAVLRSGLSYQQVLDENLNVMDATSITLCRENEIPVVVFNMEGEGNINRALRGKAVGSCVSNETHDMRVD